MMRYIIQKLNSMENIIIPIFVSCIMPVMIVFFIAQAATKKSEHKMNVMIKAIENGADVDPNTLLAVKSKITSVKERLVNRLCGGVILTVMGLMFVLATAFDLASFSDWGYYPGFPLLAAGAGLLVSFFFGKRFLKTQIEVEERK